MTVRECMTKAIEGGATREEAVRQAVKTLKVTGTTARRMYLKITKANSPKSEHDGAAPIANGLSAEELLLKHSPEHKIAAAADSLQKGRFVPEGEFIAPLGLSGGYKHIVEKPRFERFRGRAPGGVWYWSHPDSIKAMKEDRVLS